MKGRHLLKLFEELFHFLPAQVHQSWQEVSQIDSTKPTVVLISGFGATQRNLSVFRKRLKKDGFNVILVAMDLHALSDSVKGLYRMAEVLSTLILKLRKGPCIGNHKIFLVAHSAGGLVARYYIQKLGGFHYCNGLVTLATPHRGTWFALLGFLTHLLLKFRCLIQMLPISPFIKHLNQASFPLNFKFTSIYSRDDLMCSGSSSVLPETLLKTNHFWMNSEMSGLSHSDFLMSKDCYQEVSKFLKCHSEEKELPSDLFAAVNSKNISG